MVSHPAEGTHSLILGDCETDDAVGKESEAVKKFRIPCRERSPQRSPLPWGTDFKWLGASTRNGTASVP